MLRRARKVRIYVRNKQRYNPETKVRDFLYVDVEDFVGTTIADIKEDVRRQTKSSVRIDELFLNNQPLADDRSVAHYNLQHETILETTSNPFWVACLYIKVAEVKQEQEGQPDNEVIQKWTMKSIPKKYTLIGVLLNAKKEYIKQPPHFPTLDDFVLYLEQLKKKGATMHPEYTQRDMRAYEREYQQDFVGKYSDPLAAFLDHYALRLGYLEPEDIHHAVSHTRNQQVIVNNARNQQVKGRQKQGRMCDDCETSKAELYCTDCPGGIALCQPCSQLLHAGAKRRRHNLQDIGQAPKTQKPYVPRAFLAPFALTVAMYRSLTDGKLSLTEDEIKKKAQPLTDTDLMDKQNGRYVGGFDCMENMLIAKSLVKKEAARIPTYALTESGQVLGEKLYTFYATYYSFLQQHQFPKINSAFVNKVMGNRKICLIIDEHERDKDRLLAFAADKHIDAQIRFLPAGDYVWILTPPMLDTSQKYLGTDSMNEMVLPFIVERKSWEDFENSLNSARFQRQINNMLGSGIKNCYYLMEGSLSAVKSNPTQHHQHHLKAQVGKLTTEYGFYVNYTSSWMKSAQWLLWFSQFVIKGCNMGLFKDECIAYADYSSRVARQGGAARLCATFRNTDKQCHRWTSHLFIDHIFRDSQGGRSVLDTVRQDLHVSNREKHLLVIQDLEQYNKKRQSTLSKCCDAVCSDTQNAREIVSDKIGATIHNMVHYDIASFWQLGIQVMVGVYIVRTENDEDTARVRQRFLAGPQGPIPTLSPSKNNKTTPKQRTPKKKTVSKKDNQVLGDRDNSLILTGQGHGGDPKYNNRRSNIHTFPTAGTSTSEINLFNPDQSVDTHENNLQNKSSDKLSDGIPLNKVKPFSGEGRCLGIRNDLDVGNVSKNKRTSSQYNIQGTNAFHDGLVGGANESGAKKGQTTGIGGDFANPHRQVAGFQEVDYEGNPTRNEEELYRLAVAMSMKDQSGGACLARVGNMVPEAVSLARDDTVPESEDDQMKLALEMSMNESLQATNHDLDTYQSNTDEELERAIEMSKQESRQTMQYIGSIYETDTKGLKRKLDIDDNIVMPEQHLQSGLNLSEEEQLNLALELSKQKSVHNTVGAIVGIKMESAVTKESENCVHDEKDNREGILTNFANADEEEQLRIAMELSMRTSDVDTGNALSKKDVHKTNSENGNSNSVKVDDEDEQLRKAIEKSKTENYSPRKRLRTKDVRQLEIAIERSKEENYSPHKRMKSGNPKQEISPKGTIMEEYTPRMRLKAGDSEQIWDTCNEGSKVLDDVPTEVILIDSQSQEIDNGSECNNNEILEFVEDIHEDFNNDENENECLRTHVLSQYSSKTNLCYVIQPDKPSSTKTLNSRSLCHDYNSSHSHENTNTDFKYSDLFDNSTNKSEIRLRTKTLNQTKGAPRGDGTESDILFQETNEHETDKNCDDAELAIRRNTIKDCDLGDRSKDQSLHVESGSGSNCECDNEATNNSEADDAATEADDDDDFVPPTPDKRPKLSDKRTPVLPRSCLHNLYGQFSSQTKKESDKMEHSNTRFIQKSIPKAITRNSYTNTSPENAPSSRNMLANKIDLKANLFYDSDEETSEGDDSDNDNDNEKVLSSESTKETNADKEFANEPNKENEAINQSGNETKLVVSEHGNDTQRQVIDLQKQLKYSKSKIIEGDKNKLSPNKPKLTKVKLEFPDHHNAEKDEKQSDFHEDIDNEFDDELHDIDYQPNSQDLDTDSSDRDSEPGDEHEDDMEGGFEHDFDSESLPVIGQPRIIRYKQVKQKTQRLIQKKRSERSTSETSGGFKPNTKIKIEKDEKDSEVTCSSYDVKYSDCTTETDEQLARQLQSQIDNEMAAKYSLVDDEEVAKQLQEKINREFEESTKVKHEQEHVEINRTRTVEELDETYAKQLDMVLNGEKTEPNVASEHSREINSNLDKTRDRIPEMHKEKGDNSVLNMFECGDEDIAELQKRELDKIERWRKAILDDEKLAQQLQQLEDMQKNQSDEAKMPVAGTSCTSQQGSGSTESGDMCFKKMVALHKASREKALSQLDEYRQLQMERFQTCRGHGDGRTQTVPSSSLSSSRDIPRTQTHDNHVIQKDDDHSYERSTPNVFITQQHGDWFTPFNRHHSDQSQQPGPSHVTDRVNIIRQSQVPASGHVTDRDNFISQSQIPASGHVINRDNVIGQSQVPASGHVTDRDNFISQSQIPASGHVTDLSQSQVKNSNITCGNCGEKGHNRTYNMCKKYHTAEETARRQTKMEKMRVKKEEKKQMEVETLNLLTNHQQVLEEMTEQIQSEMNTIQRRLKLKTSELEKQVSNRVKKLESVKKKRR